MSERWESEWGSIALASGMLAAGSLGSFFGLRAAARFACDVVQELEVEASERPEPVVSAIGSVWPAPEGTAVELPVSDVGPSTAFVGATT